MATKKKYNWDVNTNFQQNVLDSEDVGDSFGATINEYNRNEKIDEGLGNGYEKTDKYNFYSKYDDKLNSLREQKENYEDFSYDPYSDDAYKSLAKVYSRNAERATSNALAQAAVANGGRVSAGVGTAAALAYQDKMAQLEAEIPALRNAAYQMYTDKYNRLGETLNDYINADATDYSRWGDRYNRLYQGLRDRAEDARMNSYYDTINESTRFRDQLAAAETFGSATEVAAPILGVTAGTQTSNHLNNNVQNQLNYYQNIGMYPVAFLQSLGVDATTLPNNNGWIKSVDLTDTQLSALANLETVNSGTDVYDWNRFFGMDVPLNNPGVPSVATYYDENGREYMYNDKGEKMYTGGEGYPNMNDTGFYGAPAVTPTTNNGGSGNGGGLNYGGGSSNSGNNKGNNNSGSNKGSGNGGGISASEQIASQRTDQGKAMKAEELYKQKQISWDEYVNILEKYS